MSVKLLKREPIDWLAERDVDVLVCVELHTNPDFRVWFLSRLTGKVNQTKDFVGAWVSVAEGMGESDLVVCARARGRSDRTLGLLIENKIAAPFQPAQAVRYRQRGEAGVREGAWEGFSTVLMAPTVYIEKTDPDDFDNAISYEDVASWFEAHGLDRSRFLARLLRRAIEQSQSGWELIPHEPTTKFWQAYWEVSAREFPELRLDKPSPKPSRSTWPYFRRTGLPKNVVIIHKMEKGYVDLSFSDTLETDLYLSCREFLEPEMEVEQTGRSAVVRLSVPVLDASREFEEQQDGVRQALAAASQLLQFFHTNQNRFERLITSA